MAEEAIVYDDPGAFKLSVEGGWSNKYIWRGIDLVQFTSFNHIAPAYGNTLPKADSDIYWFGVNATVHGFGFGVKYVESFEDNLNPFYTRYIDTTDKYSEWIFSANYTYSLVESWLEGTVGFDFIYYPNGEFWGVQHQGMAYLNLRMPRYKWVQPYLDLFYNIPTTDSPKGYYANPANSPPPGFRGATGSDLVEGWGFELGVAGGDQLASNDWMAWGLGYSVSTIYKNGYAFEDDGFSHLVLTLSSPITFGESFTLTPSVSYVEALTDISNPVIGTSSGPTALVGAGGLASAWNEPGWVASVKASWTF